MKKIKILGSILGISILTMPLSVFADTYTVTIPTGEAVELSIPSPVAGQNYSFAYGGQNYTVTLPGQTTPTTTNTQPPTQSHVYKNSTFNATATIPSDFTVYNKNNNANTEVGKDFLNHFNEPYFTDALSADRYSETSAVYNYNLDIISFVTHNVTGTGINTGADYIKVSNSADKVAYNYSNIDVVNIGGVGFAHESYTEVNQNGITLYYDMYVYVSNGYAFRIETAYQTAQGQADIQKILNSVKFN